jgi:predicted 3-demethylubiquinone-9 3-methyltransferase (glyoxalase superfamily)
MTNITPCLWFNAQAHEAAEFYTSVFPNSRITRVSHYDDGRVLMVAFELDGKPFTALNGGADHPFTPAVSLQIDCASQDEVDRYWDALSDGGHEDHCSWVQDRFGLSWQVIPARLPELLAHPDPEVAQRVMAAMLQMGKIDVAVLEEAALAPA